MESNDFGGSTEDPRKKFEGFLLREPLDERIVNSKIFHGGCYALNEEQHFTLKERIAAQFSLSAHQDIFLVGSAKLGYSIAPRKRYRPFSDTSDIDIAIVSHDLYQRVWHEAHTYADSGADWLKKEKFQEYISWGWIRPDMLPRSPT